VFTAPAAAGQSPPQYTIGPRGFIPAGAPRLISHDAARALLDAHPASRGDLGGGFSYRERPLRHGAEYEIMVRPYAMWDAGTGAYS
jgi:hypothetical protein